MSVIVLKFKTTVINSYQGRPFAWQEALICLAMLLQKFDFALADPSYTLELKQTLTIKPKAFYVHAIPRHSDQRRFIAAPSAPSFSANAGNSQNAIPNTVSENALPLYVLYGSNTGTSERFAQRIAEGAARHGV